MYFLPDLAEPGLVGLIISKSKCGPCKTTNFDGRKPLKISHYFAILYQFIAFTPKRYSIGAP